jgi:hypothetical protein
MCWYFFPFYTGITFHCMGRSCFVCPSGFFDHLHNIHVQSISQTCEAGHLFLPPCLMPMSHQHLSVLLGRYMPSLLRSSLLPLLPHFSDSNFSHPCFLSLCPLHMSAGALPQHYTHFPKAFATSSLLFKYSLELQTLPWLITQGLLWLDIIPLARLLTSPLSPRSSSTRSKRQKFTAAS